MISNCFGDAHKRAVVLGKKQKDNEIVLKTSVESEILCKRFNNAKVHFIVITVNNTSSGLF